MHINYAQNDTGKVCAKIIAAPDQRGRRDRLRSKRVTHIWTAKIEGEITLDLCLLYLKKQVSKSAQKPALFGRKK